MLLFHAIHMMLSILFPDDLLRILGKFVTTLHSSNSSSNCYHCVEHTLSFYHYAIHWLTFHMDRHSLLSSFWIWSSFLFHHFCCFFPYVCHCSLHLFYLSSLSHWLYLSSNHFPNGILIFWDEGTELISTWLPCSLCFLRNVS